MNTIGSAKHSSASFNSSFYSFPVIPVNFFLLDLIGRKKCMATNCLGAAIGFLLLQICTTRGVLTGISLVIRANCTGMFLSVYIYTTEVSVLNRDPSDWTRHWNFDACPHCSYHGNSTLHLWRIPCQFWDKCGRLVLKWLCRYSRTWLTTARINSDETLTFSRFIPRPSHKISNFSRGIEWMFTFCGTISTPKNDIIPGQGHTGAAFLLRFTRHHSVSFPQLCVRLLFTVNCLPKTVKKT